MDLPGLRAMNQVLGWMETCQPKYRVIHEHEAIHFRVDMDRYVDHLVAQGFEIKKRPSNVVAFVQRGNLRWEIIPQTTPEHHAWAADDVKGFFEMFSHMAALPNTFQHLREWNVNEQDIQAAMFLHLITGDHVQIIWRREQIFDGVFD